MLFYKHQQLQSSWTLKNNCAINSSHISFATMLSCISLWWQIHLALLVVHVYKCECVYIIQRNMFMCMWVFVHMYSWWSLKSILRTISKRATFLEHPDISSPAWNHPCLPWCSPQPANKQKKMRVKYFCCQLIAPIPEYKVLKFGDNSCCETLAYFKHTPAKIKIITNTHYFVLSFAIQIILPC
jgi:hypothetical protein